MKPQKIISENNIGAPLAPQKKQNFRGENCNCKEELYEQDSYLHSIMGAKKKRLPPV